MQRVATVKKEVGTCNILYVQNHKPRLESYTHLTSYMQHSCPLQWKISFMPCNHTICYVTSGVTEAIHCTDHISSHMTYLRHASTAFPYMYAWILNQSAGYKHRHVFYAANGTSHLLYIRAENVSDNRWVFFEDRFGFRVKRSLHWHLQHHPKPLGAS